jgi:hypothetical protein
MSLITRTAKGSKLTIQEMDGNLTYLEQLALDGGGGIGGTQYIFVQANGTDIENATELQAAYDLAKTMSPTSDNRITVVAAPGIYKFPSTFVMDTEYIDLISLTGNRDVVFDIDVIDPFQADDNTGDVVSTGECLLVDTDNVFVKGIKGKFYLSPNWDDYWGEGEDYILPIQVSNNLPSIVIENCEGGIWSFGGDVSFGSNPITVNGTYINCSGSIYSFAGSGGVAAGLFINCNGSNYGLFAGDGGGIASGVFINCTVTGTNSFADFGEASGTFTNCQGGNSCFGAVGIASGIFNSCIGNGSAFGGNGGTASGIFNNCVGGAGSFGLLGTLSGKLFYCRLTSFIFETVSGGGRTYYCVDGNGDPNNQ